MLKILIFFLLCPFLSFQQFLEDETICTINGKRVLHKINEKYLSISVDPALLLTGLNLSDISLKLAKNLGPAYIRIAGPSTPFVKFVDSDADFELEDTNLLITRSIWFGINEWLSLANLTPIFGINDSEWTPKSVIPLLDISEKLNITCLWQLGFDCSNKTETQYKEDLQTFRNILDGFPSKKGQWEIVASDFRMCGGSENFRRLSDELQTTVKSVITESTDDSLVKLVNNPLKPKLPIWLSTPKDLHPVTFNSAISWAQEICESAKNGYEVVFRQPRIHEIFSDTPVYWVSVLFNNLMGRTVLDSKSTGLNSEVAVYAHCTRRQNNYAQSGAMTVAIINNSTTNQTVLVKFGNVLLKNTEVNSYILTSPNWDSKEIYMNGAKLGLSMLQDDSRPVFEPKLRRAKIINYLTLEVPEKSIGFFVLPSAHIPVCVSDENELNDLMQEIGEDQKIQLSDEVSVELSPRVSSSHSRGTTLKDIHNQMEKELESDEKLYKKLLPYLKAKKRIDDDHHHHRNHLIERPKFVRKKQPELGIFKEIDIPAAPSVKELDLELTSEEIKRILTDRARVKAAKKNIVFSSKELEEIMEKATERFLKNRHTSIRIKPKIKRDTVRDKTGINTKLQELKSLGEKRRLLLKKIGKSVHDAKDKMHFKRFKRDINMKLLKLKTEILGDRGLEKRPSKLMFEDGAAKEANLRKPGQTSEELLQDFEETGKNWKNPRKGEIYAELADSKEPDLEESDQPKKTILDELKAKLNAFGPVKPVKPQKNFGFATPKPAELPTSPPPAMEEIIVSEEKFSELPCIHEFIGPSLDSRSAVKANDFELYEIGQMREPNKEPDLPTILSRGGYGMRLWEDFPDNLDLSLEAAYGDLDNDDDGTEAIRLKRDNKDLITAKIKTLKQKIEQQKRMRAMKKQTRENLNRKIRSVLYNPKTDSLPFWRPHDILQLKKKPMPIMIDNRNNQKRKAILFQRTKRYISHDINSLENMIDVSNEIVKDTDKLVEMATVPLTTPSMVTMATTTTAPSTVKSTVKKPGNNNIFVRMISHIRDCLKDIGQKIVNFF